MEFGNDSSKKGRGGEDNHDDSESESENSNDDNSNDSESESQSNSCSESSSGNEEFNHHREDIAMNIRPELETQKKQ